MVQQEAAEGAGLRHKKASVQWWINTFDFLHYFAQHHNVTDKRSGLPVGGAEQEKIQLLWLLIQQFSTNSKCWVYSRCNLMRLLHLNANMMGHQPKEQGCRRETSFKPQRFTSWWCLCFPFVCKLIMLRQPIDWTARNIRGLRYVWLWICGWS